MKLNMKKITKLLAASSLLTLSSVSAYAEVIAIEGVTIHTQTSEGTLQNATILIEDGEITEIGKAVRVPRDAQVFDGKGKAVTPGLIDPSSYLGLEEVSLESTTVDHRTSNPSYGAGFDISSAVNSNSTLIPINRIEGITHAITAPNAAHSAFAGLGAAIHLGPAHDVESVIKPQVAMFANLGSAPETASGGSRAATLQSIRAAFDDANFYADGVAEYEEGAMRDLSVSKADLEALQKVLDKDIPLVVNASRVSDIKALVKLADDYDFDLVLNGAQQAWMVKDLLAENDVAVIVNPIDNLPGSFDSLGARLDNAALLNAAGVKVLITDGWSHNSRNIKQLAGLATANGMPWTDALDAVSKNVAEVFGLDGLGEIEVGEKANLVLWDGDPLEVTTYADQVFIDGAAISMVSRAPLLRDRYLDKSDTPKAYIKPATVKSN